MILFILGFFVILVLLIGLVTWGIMIDAGPTQQEIDALDRVLPAECVVHDIGSYGTIDTLIVVVCDDRSVTAAHGYMRQQNGKTTEIDNSAVFVIR